MILLLLTVISNAVYQVSGQCAITNAAIRLDTSPTPQLADRDNLELIIEGITTGAQATSVTWTHNGLPVNRNTPVLGGSFYDGGGETIVGTEPCESQMYRVALLLIGNLPGSYSYTVTNANTPTPVTSPIFRVEEPSPPTNIVLSQISNRRAQATWTPPAGRPGATYRVYINTVDVINGGIPVTGTTYTTDPLSTGFTVTIRVRATTGTYLSVPTVSETITIRDVLSPIIFVSTVTGTSVTLSFSQPANSLSVDMYTVTLTSTTCTEVPTRTGSTISASVTIGSLEAGIQYSVSVTGRNNLAELSGTGTTTVFTTAAAPSGSPGVPTASVIMSNNITLTWTEIECLDRNGVITGYIIQYGEGTTRDRTINTQSNTTTRLITGLKPFTQYTFTVAGVNSVNTGPFSGASRIIITATNTPIGSPGVPTASIIMSTNITLTWTEIDASDRCGVITSYIIQYGEGTTRDRIINTQSNTTTHLITGLKPFTQYTFTVAGVNSVNTGPFSAPSQLIRTSQDRPTAVRNIQKTAKFIAYISWEAPQQLNGVLVYYIIQYSLNGTVQLPQATNNTNFTITNLTPSTLVCDITVSATTGGGEGPAVIVADIILSDVFSQGGNDTPVCHASDYAVPVVVSILATLLLNYFVLVIIGVTIYHYKKRQSTEKTEKSPPIELDKCPAYEKVSAEESTTSHYESVQHEEIA